MKQVVVRRHLSPLARVPTIPGLVATHVCRNIRPDRGSPSASMLGTSADDGGACGRRNQVSNTGRNTTLSAPRIPCPEPDQLHAAPRERAVMYVQD